MSKLKNNAIELFVSNQGGEPVVSKARDDNDAFQGLSHDASCSHQHNTGCTSILGPGTASDTGVEEGYYDIDVPEDIDSRTSYGRRKTKDFGYPGAYIKRRSTPSNNEAPLNDPGNWIKRACGHFSKMSAVEVREEALARPCRKCYEKHGRLDSTLSKYHTTHVHDVSSSSTGSFGHNEGHQLPYKHERHHSECMPSDKCGDDLAEDLGYVIDSILEEHMSTLQDVINNIQFDRPNLVRQQRVDQGFPPRTDSQRCQSRRTAKQRRQRHPPPFSPKAAEKLNVGSPGLVQATLNDDWASLSKKVKSILDVINLVKSAADDFGVDLDNGPTASDDERFEKAPYEAL